MFIRKKKNKSGCVSVQVISKAGGKYKVVKTVGNSEDPKVIEKLFLEAYHLIPALNHQKTFELETEADKQIERFIDTLDNTHFRIIGPELIFGALFDRIGFNIFPNDLFRHLVITRLVYPGSKLKTIDYLQRYKGIFVSSDRIYRFLDNLQSNYKDKVESITFEFTKKVLQGKITVVFYDMTTLYFEAEDEDDLRKIGFSKDGKFQQPQIMIGLLVGEQGYPIGYDIFEGNTFEGHTLLPILKAIQKKYAFPQPIVVADAALLSKNNLKELQEKKYTFIIGARIKNETNSIKEEILKKSEGAKDGDGIKIKRPDGIWLIITYSSKRARKDKYNREKGLGKLKQKIRSGNLTKNQINNRGYNKFLTIEGAVQISLDEEKVKADEKWDGLKGYATNTELPIKEIIENYTHLWQIEKAFRISKSDLKVRPIFHRLKKRIEAHICISFAAYVIYKELERLLYKNEANFSVKRAIELTQNMHELVYTLPDSQKEKTKYLKMNDDQKFLLDIIKKD